MANTEWPQNHTRQIAFPRISQHSHIKAKSVIVTERVREWGRITEKERQSEEWKVNLEPGGATANETMWMRETNTSRTNHQAEFHADKLICPEIDKSLSHSKQKCSAHSCKDKTEQIPKQTQADPHSLRTVTHTYTHTHTQTKLKDWDMERLDELFQTSVLMRWNNFTPLKTEEQLCQTNYWELCQMQVRGRVVYRR